MVLTRRGCGARGAPPHAADGLEALTPRTVTTLVGLRQRVGEVRRTGVSWTVGEFAEEITGVAAAIPGHDGGPVGSLTVYGPGFRFPGDADTCAIEQVVRDAVARVGARLGG